MPHPGFHFRQERERGVRDETQQRLDVAVYPHVGDPREEHEQHLHGRIRDQHLQSSHRIIRALGRVRVQRASAVPEGGLQGLDFLPGQKVRGSEGQRVRDAGGTHRS